MPQICFLSTLKPAEVAMSPVSADDDVVGQLTRFQLFWEGRAEQITTYSSMCVADF